MRAVNTNTTILRHLHSAGRSLGSRSLALAPSWDSPLAQLRPKRRSWPWLVGGHPHCIRPLSTESTTDADNFQVEEFEKLKHRLYEKLAGGPDSPVRIADVEGRGRAILARRRFAEGELIAAEKPFVSHLFPDEDGAHRCEHCMGSLPPELDNAPSPPKEDERVCNACGQVYCSSACRQEAWSQYHEAICRIGDKVDKMKNYCRPDKWTFPLLAMRIMARALLTYRETGLMDSTLLPLHMLSFANIKPDLWAADYELFQKCFVSHESHASLFDFNWYCRMMQICHLNSVSITMDSTNKKVGIGLYMLSSFYNHSCDPNTRSSNPENNTWRIYAKRTIEEGQEICISYIDPMTNKSVRERRQRLHNNYGFWCFCPRCVEEMKKEREQKGL